MSLLTVDNLSVRFATQDGEVAAVSNMSFTIAKGQTLAIVGESGSGKSQTAFAIMQLLAPNGSTSGQVMFDGKDLLTLSTKEMNRVRANRIGMIFQDAMTSLNPYLKVSDQLTEVLMLHKGMSKKDALAESIRMLDAVRIPEAKKRVHMYPHESSGGMRQRIMIAMALLCRPELLIADEPTTALDVTIQAQILDLFRDLREKIGMSVMLITHDLGVIAETADRIAVMYAGNIVETASAAELF
ncbi:MAG TPA: ATP-binding cassette domain-containing protein, partial [Paracoccaceae bacterium]|nr:ATP-binding cassette domain-containing protein [Paracoccaceae bacterium]